MGPFFRHFSSDPTPRSVSYVLENSAGERRMKRESINVMPIIFPSLQTHTHTYTPHTHKARWSLHPFILFTLLPFYPSTFNLQSPPCLFYSFCFLVIQYYSLFFILVKRRKLLQQRGPAVYVKTNLMSRCLSLKLVHAHNCPYTYNEILGAQKHHRIAGIYMDIEILIISAQTLVHRAALRCCHPHRTGTNGLGVCGMKRPQRHKRRANLGPRPCTRTCLHIRNRIQTHIQIRTHQLTR